MKHLSGSCHERELMDNRECSFLAGGIMEEKNNENISEENMSLEGIKMEYAAIRDEIILLMNEHNTHITNMFLISITILGLGCEFQNLCIFLILYLLVIPFQILINNKQYMMIRCGVYLGMYVEPKIEGMRWEKTVHRVDNVFKEKYKAKIFGFKIEDGLCDFGAFLFSAVSLAFYTYYCFPLKSDTMLLQIVCISGEIIAIVCTVIAFYLCNKGKEFDKIYQEFTEIMKDEFGLRRHRRR